MKAIIKRDDNSVPFAGVALPCLKEKTITFEGVAQVDTVTLTGTSGTANVQTAGGLTKLATFATDLETTAANFVTAHAAAYLAVGITVTSDGADLIFTSSTPGVAFASPTVANVTGDLDGTVDNTTANGAVTNSAGDVNGTGNPTTIFTVKGVVRAKIFAVCDEGLLPVTAGGTIEVGISGNTAAIIAQTTQADIDTNEMWHDATPAAFEDIPSTVFTLKEGQNVIQTVATQDCTYGELHYICMFEPLSADGNVV